MRSISTVVETARQTLARAGRNHGRDRSWKVVWARFSDLGAKNFRNFSLCTLERFTKSSAAANRRARDRRRQRFGVRSARSGTRFVGRRLPRSPRRRTARRRSSPNCRWRSLERLARARVSVLSHAVLSQVAAHVRRHSQRARTNSTIRSLALGERRKIPVIPVSGAWYGFDPIHLKRSTWREAWPTMLSAWRDGEAKSACGRARRSRGGPICVRSRRRSITFLASQRRAQQPSGVLSDGTTISLY